MIINFAVAKPHFFSAKLSNINVTKEMCDKNLLLIILLAFAIQAKAEFYTITKDKEISYKTRRVNKETIDSLSISVRMTDSLVKERDLRSKVEGNNNKEVSSQECNTYASPKNQVSYATVRKRQPRRKTISNVIEDERNLPELTIPNLLKEIERNGIKYPKIVLAQAILETGWFTSSVCRNKNNLFGLTNPRTKTYYEFDHWTESVKAYYTKVQYRYKGGNYLLWLRDIGYAEDKGYIQAVIKVLKQL